MAINFVNDSATISTTEYGLASDSTSIVAQTDDCMLQGWINFTGITAEADVFRVRFLEKINGSAQLDALDPIYVNTPRVLVLPGLIVGEGWEITVTKITGADRSIGWSLRKLT